MVFERGNGNSALEAANTICSNKQIQVQEQLSCDIQPDFPLKHLLSTAEKSIALTATRIKLMGNAANFSKQPSSFASFITCCPQLSQLQARSPPPRFCKRD